MIVPNLKSCAVRRPLIEGFRELDLAWVFMATANVSFCCWPSERPNCFDRYDGGLEVRGLRLGTLGLCVLGDEKGRVGRGIDCGRESELDEVDMTDAFLLRSAKVGGNVGSRGERAEGSTDSIQRIGVQEKDVAGFVKPPFESDFHLFHLGFLLHSTLSGVRTRCLCSSTQA
jgi:hypothetical protein